MTACFHTHKFKQKAVSRVSGETRKVVRLVAGIFDSRQFLLQESQNGEKESGLPRVNSPTLTPV